MLSNHQIVAIEYKGGIPEYDDELKIISLLKKLHEAFDEVFILKTSQRFSIYVYAPAFFQLQDFLSKEGITYPNDYFLNTRTASKHLFELASGVKANLLGESDILEKIEIHLKLAESQGTIGPFLLELIHNCIDCGRSIQKNTSTSNIKQSFLSAGMDFIYERYQTFNLRILVVGTAELAESILKFLKKHEVERIYIANHSYEDAKRLANQYGAFPLKGENMSVVFPVLDVVFCCGNKDKLMNAIYEHQENAENNDKEGKRPLFIDYDTIDTVSDFSQNDKTLSQDYFNQYAVGENGVLKISDIISAGEMIEQCTEDFVKKVHHLKADPILKKYWVQVRQIEQKELDILFSKLNNPSAEIRALIEQYTQNLLRKISEGPFNQIKKLAEEPLENQEYLRVINDILNKSKNS